MKKYLLVTIFLSMNVFTLFSQNIHVSITGSDETGDGSMENPYATITQAATVATPGDTVFIHEGVYHNQAYDNGDIWESSTLATIKCSGTEDAYIVFTTYKDDDVLLEFDGSYGVVVQNNQYVKIENLTIKGIADKITEEEAVEAWGWYKDENGVIHDLAEEMDVDITDPSLWGEKIDKPATPNAEKPSYYNGRALVAISSQHIILSNNVIRDAPSSAIRVQKSDYVSVVDNKVYNNTFWSTLGVGAITVAEATNYSDETEDNIRIRLERNDVHNNANKLYSWNPNKDFVKFVIDEGSGLFLTRNNDTYNYGYILIANNLSYNNGASGIVVHKTNRAIVEHNTVYYNGTYNGDSKAGGIGVNTVDDVTIRNNISWAMPVKSAIYKLADPITNTVIEANIVYNEDGSQDVVSGLPSDGCTEENPLLYGPQIGDFKLKPDSPAIDNGVADNVVDVDFSGYPRDDGHPDIGAYEYHSSSGINNNSAAKSLKIFPNPANDYLHVKFKGAVNEITVFDISGKRMNLKGEKESGEYVIFNTRNLSPGIYFIKIKDFTGKFIKN